MQSIALQNDFEPVDQRVLSNHSNYLTSPKFRPERKGIAKLCHSVHEGRCLDWKVLRTRQDFVDKT